MNRFRGLTFVLALGVALPAAAAGQQFKDSKYTKDADKFLALAMTRSEKADRDNFYRQALAALEEGFTKEANNAKIWYTAGQAYIGLGDYVAADTCFDKAVALHPEVAEDIEAEREQGWMQAFNEGVTLMDQQQFDQALAVLEASQQLYDKRPEALLNIGSIYANNGNPAKAEEAFRKAAEAAQGELLAKLDSASQENWKRYAEMATLNIAQMRGARGVEAFNANDLDAAATAFKSAFEVNPYSRDYLFNYVQAKYAKATELEEQYKENPSLGTQLIELYTEIEREIPKVREFDPMFENLLMIQGVAVRRIGEIKGDTMAGREAALALFTQADELPVEISDLTIATDETGASVTVSGNMRNKKVAPGTPVKIDITLLGYKGDTIGQMSITVNAGEAGEDAAPVSFQQNGPITASVAGWKYTVSS